MLLPVRQARARARRPFVTEDSPEPTSAADVFRCAFPEGEAAYNGIGIGADGTIHFALSSKSKTPGRIFAFDPQTERVRGVADLGTAFPSNGARAIPQGKVHVDLEPAGDRLYGATHLGYYEPGEAKERPGHAAGYAPYPGGWFFAIANGRLLPCAQAPGGEGVITMRVDAARSRAHALTWPSGRLLGVDLPSGRLQDHGPVMGAGEAGSVDAGQWRRVCRSLAVHPATGHVFWSDDAGAIWRLAGDRIETVARLPIADIWRKVCWHPERRIFYGWTWREALLFTFDPETLVCRALATLPAPGTLAFALDAAGTHLHILARGPGMIRRGQIQLAETVTHLTYDVDSGALRVRGRLCAADGCGITQAQSLLLAGEQAFAVAWVEVSAADRSDYARAVRACRRDVPAYRVRGYAEEIALVRFAT